MSDRKAVIKNADMSEEMQQDAVECATQALEKYNIEKDIAAYIKKVHTMPITTVVHYSHHILALSNKPACDGNQSQAGLLPHLLYLSHCMTV